MSADLPGRQPDHIQHGLDGLTEQARAIVVHVAAEAAEPPGTVRTLPLPGLAAAG